MQLNLPVQVSQIRDSTVYHNKDLIKNIFSKAGQRKIICIQFIGDIGRGKTSIISRITGNKKYEIGDGLDQMTKGIWIDGPYSINDITNTFQIPPYNTSKEDPALFFIDSEGFGGKTPQKVLSNLNLPYLTISKIVVILSEKAESPMSYQIAWSILHDANDQFQLLNNTQLPFSVIHLIKDVVNINNTLYDNPIESNYIQISQYLDQNWPSKQSEREPFPVYKRPLPKFNSYNDIFDQSDNFFKGFQLFVKDLLNILYSNINSSAIYFNVIESTIDNLFTSNHQAKPQDVSFKGTTSKFQQTKAPETDKKETNPTQKNKKTNQRNQKAPSGDNYTEQAKYAPTQSRPPVQVATVQNKSDAVHNRELVESMLKKAGERRVVCIQFLGNYQQGKTSTISLITGNNGHRIGNGSSEETRGIWIDGPYSINDITDRFEIPRFDNIPDDPAIFFVDCEGSGGFLSGENTEQNQLIMAHLDVPFASISPLVILMANKNEPIGTFETITSILKLSEFTARADVINKSSITVMPLVKDVGIIEDIEYFSPNEDNYLAISNILEQDWQTRGFKDKDFSVITKPLPVFDISKSIFMQSNDFYHGFRLIVQDILNVLVTSLNSFTVYDPQGLYELYKTTIDCLDKENFGELIRNAKVDKSRETVVRIIQLWNERIMKEITEDITQFFSNIEGAETQDINQLFSTIQKFHEECNNKVELTLNEKLPKTFTLVDSFNECKVQMMESINSIIDDKSKELIIKISPAISQTVISEIDQFMENTIDHYIQMISTIEGYLEFKNKSDQYYKQIENDLERVVNEICERKAKGIESVKSLAMIQSRNVMCRIRSCLRSRIETQEMKFTEKKIEMKKSPDVNDDEVMITYSREVIKYPDGHVEEKEWQEISRDKLPSCIEEETRIQTRGNCHVLQVRKKVKKGNGKVEFGEWCDKNIIPISQNRQQQYQQQYYPQQYYPQESSLEALPVMFGAVGYAISGGTGAAIGTALGAAASMCNIS